jgi:hypothetical protein
MLEREVPSRKRYVAHYSKYRTIDYRPHRLHTIERERRICAAFTLAAVENADRRIVTLGD